ncbi:endonuclease III domain-containing protein [Thioalkalivibrio sp.]|uniref:endonuclease III domain-containing protein n=1 Tax=Thioalkalivibrio sp. TaxID=2093813 RepID=UPI00397670AF
MEAPQIRDLVQRLGAAFGPMRWWPAESPLEVVIGAVLTQNTRWENVERAMGNLRRADCLALESLLALPEADLGQLIRPSGYYNIKARRLRSLLRFVAEHGGIDALADWETEPLREALLAVHGIGPETADDILLYAFGRPVFVVDAYTRRLFGRLQWADAKAGYESLRGQVENALGADAAVLNELHALIVEHGKRYCRPRPRCEDCPLAVVCTEPLRRAGG